MATRRDLAIRALLGTALLAAGAAPAAQYNVIAIAGGQGDNHESVDDPDASASSVRTGATGGTASYDALADLSRGLLYASMSIDGGNQVSFAGGGLSASARFEETIAFQQSLGGPVTISASMAPGLEAGAPQVLSGFGAAAQAFALLEVAGCRTALTTTNGGEAVDTSVCDNEEYGWQAGAGSVVVVIDPQVFPSFTEVGIEAATTVQFTNPQYVLSGEASATASVHVSVSPDVAFAFVGSRTSFPAPEPDAAALGVVVLGALGVRGRSRV